MSKHTYPPGGGAVNSRREDKMGSQKILNWQGFENAARAYKKMMKRSSTKKRRQRDKIVE